MSDLIHFYLFYNFLKDFYKFFCAFYSILWNLLGFCSHNQNNCFVEFIFFFVAVLSSLWSLWLKIFLIPGSNWIKISMAEICHFYRCIWAFRVRSKGHTLFNFHNIAFISTASKKICLRWGRCRWCLINLINCVYCIRKWQYPSSTSFLPSVLQWNSVLFENNSKKIGTYTNI